MSFGISFGDFLTLGQMCWKVYKKCKGSSSTYTELSGEVNGLRAVIQETQELLSEQHLTKQQEERLRPCQLGCETVLKDLDALLVKYESLGTNSQSTFDRIGMGSQDVISIRQRLILNVTMLYTFNNASSHARLERKLDRLISEIRAGKREGSVISTEGFAVANEHDRETWEALRKDLEDIGISPQAIKEQRTFILDWFREALAAGKLEEDTPLDESDSLHIASGSERGISSEPVVQSRLELNTTSVPAAEGKPTTGGGRASDPISKPYPKASNEPASTRVMQLQRRRRIEKLPLRVSYLINSLQGKNTELLDAAKAGDDSQIYKLLSRGADIHTTDEKGDTVLHLATAYGIARTVELLLGNGAEIDAKNAIGTNALAWAGFYHTGSHGHEAAAKVRLLLKYGANPEFATCLGTPVIVTTAMSSLLLLEHGVNVEAKTSSGATPLLIAVFGSNSKALSILLDKGANIEAKTNSGDTPLLAAVRRRNNEAVSLLLAQGANVEAKNGNDETALLLASQLLNKKAVSLLLKKGAYIEARNGKGETPLILALRREHADGLHSTVRLLLAKGANIHAADMKGRSVSDELRRFWYVEHKGSFAW
ncbi:MAG: hypothetical protein Q9166_001944 [cf. Caloplaca sp. 2 TL-2023]